MATQAKSEFERVRVSADPPHAQIVLNHPPQNVIDIPMMEELGKALGDLESRAEISTVVFSGSSNAFSAGVDVAAHQPATVGEMLTKFHAVIRTVVNSKKVMIAVVRGNCLGGGAELAMVCDLVLTARDAKWGFPEIKLACFPPVAVTALAALVGQKRAAELVLTGRQISGAEAAAIGLANYSLDDDNLPPLLQEQLERLSKLSPAALAVTKKAAYAWDAMHFEKGLARAEQIYLDELMKTADAQEGIEAWLEKREPKWKNK